VWRAGARAFFGLLFAPIWLAGMILTVLDSRRRAAHDLLMGTIVRRVRPNGHIATPTPDARPGNRF